MIGYHAVLLTLAILGTSLLQLPSHGNCSPLTPTNIFTRLQRSPSDDQSTHNTDLNDPDNNQVNNKNIDSDQTQTTEQHVQRASDATPATAQHQEDGSHTTSATRLNSNTVDTTSHTETTMTSSPLLDKLAESSALFTWDAYRGMDVPAESNFFFSPLSLINALGMLALGSGEGIARDQLLSALHVDRSLTTGSLDHGVQQENARLRTTDDQTTNQENISGKSSPGVTLLVANKFYVDRARAAANINPEYLQNISDFYGASMQAVNFSLDLAGTVRLINGWVSNNTRGKITDLVPQSLDPQTQLILANAVYFDGRWNSSFDAQSTFQGDFHLSKSSLDGAKKVRVSFMTQSNQMLFAEDDALGVTTVVLPYAGDSNIAMHIVVPNGDRELSELESSGVLDAKVLRKLAQKTRKQLVQLSLPKFSLKHEMELSGLMKMLNATAVFHPLTNEFSNIFLNPRPGFFVNEILHQALVEVDERGTVAAAATAVVGTRSSFPRFPLLVNRPFLFYIADQTNGFVLFWGRVGDPSKGN